MQELLFLTNEIPFPPNGGGKMRDFYFIQILSEIFKIKILSFSKPQNISLPIENSNLEIQLITRDRQPFWKRLFYPIRPYFMNGYSNNMEMALKENAKPRKILWVSRIVMSQYIPVAKKLGYHVILDEHNIESDLLIRLAKSSFKKWHHLPLAKLSKHFELKSCLAADQVITTSTQDSQLLQSSLPHSKIEVLPNTINFNEFENVRQSVGKTLFFPGTLNYFPNQEGILWFIRKVLPLLKLKLRESLPKIVIAGSNPNPFLIKQLKRAEISLHINPSSMIPYFSEASIVFVPILSGSGTRLKILEACAGSRAVVSTTKGAEGLNLIHRQEILIADTPETFASSLIEFIQNPDLRDQIARESSNKILKEFDWQTLRPKLKSLFNTHNSKRIL